MINGQRLQKLNEQEVILINCLSFNNSKLFLVKTIYNFRIISLILFKNNEDNYILIYKY